MVDTETAPAEKASILIVDDEPQVLIALEDILSDQFIVHTTRSPEQALNLAAQERDIAVVISDQRMPKMTGDELLGRLSTESQAERILVTGYADLSAVIKAVNDGRIFAYITKPWNPDELQLKVQQAAEHFRLAKELAHERQLLRDLMGNMPDGIYFKDPELRFLKVNEPLERMLCGNGSVDMVGRRLTELESTALDAEATEEEERRILADGIQVVDDIREYKRGDRRQWFSETKVRIRSATGAVIGLVGISRNVSDRIEAEQARERQQQRIARLTRIHAMLSGVNSAIVRAGERDALLREACTIAVSEGQLTFATIVAYDETNASCQVVAAVGPTNIRLTSRTLRPGEPVEQGHLLFDRVAHSRAPVILNDAQRDLDGPRLHDGRVSPGAVAAFPLFAAGELRYVFALASTQPGFFDSDEVRLLTDLAGNISFALDHFAAKDRLDFLAYYDELTGLANQRLLMDRLAQQIATCRSVGKKLALAMLDIDRFRQVNETLGREGGDELLRQVGARLKARIGGQDSLARVDGNRFAVLVPLVEDESDVASLVEELLVKIHNDSFQIGDIEVLIAVRFGISLFPSDGETAETLVYNAEAALKKAKSQGQRYVFYAPTMNERVAEKLTLETRLRRALEHEEFVLYYQPKVELRRGAIVGLEALIRWQPPGEKLVPPGVFIPVLEETGLIVDVGRWVLMSAAAQYTSWARAGLNPPRVAVNVSALQLGQPDFLRSIEETLASYELASRGIDLEITESVFVEDLEGNVSKLTAAREHGLQVAIDDFGTGYSSLAYLSRLPIDILKIDRSFVTRMTKNPHDTALVTTVISLAHSLECKVVAEGVELPEQAQLLRLLRCDQIQGYLIGKPAPAAEITACFGEHQMYKWSPTADQ